MGRPVGSKNKAGSSARENIVAVFNRLQGTAGMAKWAENNLTDFYKIYGRLIPQDIKAELSGPNGGPQEMRITFVNPGQP